MPRAARWQIASAYGALLVVACVSLFANLDDRPLWGDEAETALLATRVLQFGVPRVDDGHNRIGHLGVADSNDAGLWTWSPWLDEYVAASAFALGGESAFSARFPFALAGLATIALLGWLAQRLRRDHETTLMAMALLATCLPFLLHARQCRYYALVTFAMVLLLLGFSQLLQRERLGSVSIAAALSILFYSNYVAVPGPTLALGIAVLLFSPRHPGLLRGVAIGLSAFAVLALPWVAYAGLGAQAATLGFAHFAPNLVYYASELHFHVVPWIVLAAPLALAFLARGDATRAFRNRELVVFIALIVGAQLLLLGVSPFRFFRYLTPLIPPLLLLTALLLRDWLQPAWLRRTLVALLCTSNLLAFGSLFPLAAHHPPDAPHLRLLLSLARDYDDRVEDVVRFLKEEGSASESISVPDPEFPLIFHTGMAVRDARATGAWPPPSLPDWVLPTSPSAIAVRPPLQMPAELAAGYREQRIEVRASARGGGRPDPHAYEFFTAEGREEQIVYRRRR
jgi:4-amino-4-deoxy-L-arabinose transferase-like glycosyltransferase